MNHNIILAEIKNQKWIETDNEDDLKKGIAYWEERLLELFPKNHEVFSRLAEISFEPKAAHPALYDHKKLEALEKGRNALVRFFDKIPELYGQLPIIDLSFEEIIKHEESHYLEYKPSMTRGTAVDSGPDRIMKAVAAFLNSDGGVLVIGMDDKKNPIGINRDYTELDNFKPPTYNSEYYKQEWDGFQNCFITLLKKYGFKERIEICLIRIKKSDEPVIIDKKNKYGRSLSFVNIYSDSCINVTYDEITKTLAISGKGSGMNRADLNKSLAKLIINSQHKNLFYIRVDNSSRLLTGTKKIADYVYKHFKK